MQRVLAFAESARTVRVPLRGDSSRPAGCSYTQVFGSSLRANEQTRQVLPSHIHRIRTPLRNGDECPFNHGQHTGSGPGAYLSRISLITKQSSTVCCIVQSPLLLSPTSHCLMKIGTPSLPSLFPLQVASSHTFDTQSFKSNLNFKCTGQENL